ncbi:MAG: DNA-binding protein, partial [Synechococcaceae bacterium WB9_4xC_028]|nr:DNA-binding protein [Synechococcaceae bacterium WB9_4xC_028]
MSLNTNQASSPEGTSISWLTTPELCSQLGISRSTLRRWCRRGVLREGQHWIRMNPS